MALKYIPASWMTSMASDYNHDVNFYINPRGRRIPAMTSAGISYIENDSSTNRRGTYRLQSGASTSLTYLYTLPQRFILEGWFKPEWAYNVGSIQIVFGFSGIGARLYYDNTVAKFRFATTVGGTANSIYSSAFSSDAELQKWIYVRCFFDNVAKLKGFYCVVDGVVYANSQNVPGAGTFLPNNSLTFFPAISLESSFWCIHELEEALATGQYKTYRADRQIFFGFNGTTLARERIRIPRSSGASDMRGVKSINSLHYAVANDAGSPCANSASITLYNINGQFSDDQYDTFNPFQGYYNGTVSQKYLQNRVEVELESVAPSALSANDYMGYVEPLLIGRTTPGAFSRNSPSALYGDVQIEIEDGVTELGETKMEIAHGFTTHDICDPAAESDSLVHDFVRLVTKKEIRNYAANASFENATISTAWSQIGGTLTRDTSTYLFGSAAAKFVSTGSGQYIYQRITFRGDDKIDVGDVFNFSGYVYLSGVSTVELRLSERDNTGAIIGSSSSVTCGTDTGKWVRVGLSRTVLSPLCVQIQIVYYATAATTFYADGTMLIRGVDSVDYFLDNTSETKNADDASSTTFDTVAIKADAVDIEHPYALIKKGETVWDHLKKISSGSLGYYLGMTPDGVFRFSNRYAEAGTSTPANLGSITDADIVSSSTSLEGAQANAIIVKGYTIATEALTQLYSGEQDANLTKNSSGKLMHPIASGAAMSVKGATEFEAAYSDSEESK